MVQGPALVEDTDEFYTPEDVLEDDNDLDFQDAVPVEAGFALFSQCLQGLAVVCVSVVVPAYYLYGGEPGAGRTSLAFTDRAARL